MTSMRVPVSPLKGFTPETLPDLWAEVWGDGMIYWSCGGWWWR